MVKQPLYLSMKEPKNRTLYAKKGDSGRIYEVYLTDAEEENGTLRVLRPDGVEVTSPAESTVSPTITDGMATFDSLEEAEVTELNIALSPKQDLSNGDPSPTNICPIYPSNGKNLLHFADADTTTNNVKRTIVNDVFTISGVASATASFSLSAITDVLASRSGTLTLSVTNRLPSGVRIYGKRTKKSDSTVNYPSFISGSDGNMGYPLDLDTYTYENIYLEVGTSYSGTPSSWSIQLEVGSVATTYVPYQGIGVNLCGKNLFNSDISNRINTPITLYGVSDGSVVNFLNTLEVGNYYLSFKVTIDTKNGTSQHNYYGVIIANSATSNIVMRNDVSNPSQGDTFSFSNAIVINESNVGKFTNFWYSCGRATAEGTDTCTFHDFQLEHGDEATSYEPYNGTTYPLSLGQSVYGGTFDVVSGKLTITHGMIDLETYADATPLPSPTYPRWKYTISDLKPTATGGEYPHAIAEQYRGVTSNQYNYVYGTFYNAVGFKTIEIVNMDSDNRPQGKLVYELDTPTEVDLTPTQISTLLGENNVWSDGEITELTFEYDGMLAELPEEATEQVGKCIADVAFTGASSMPFILHILDDVQEETP